MQNSVKRTCSSTLGCILELDGKHLLLMSTCTHMAPCHRPHREWFTAGQVRIGWLPENQSDRLQVKQQSVFAGEHDIEHQHGIILWSSDSALSANIVLCAIFVCAKSFVCVVEGLLQNHTLHAQLASV